MKKIHLFFIFIVYLICFFPYSISMANEEASYKVVHKTEIYEIRYYSDRLVAQVTNKGDNNSFRKLFNYIAGENNSSEKIKMTVPVTQTEENNLLLMQFYLPSKYNKQTTPIPKNSDIKIVTIEEGYFAVIKYSGRASDKNFLKYSEILYNQLSKDQISVTGSAIRATYNSPFTPPPFRRNEAMFNVDWKN